MQKVKLEHETTDTNKKDDSFWQNETSITNVRDDFGGIFDRGDQQSASCFDGNLEGVVF